MEIFDSKSWWKWAKRSSKKYGKNYVKFNRLKQKELQLPKLKWLYLFNNRFNDNLWKNPRPSRQPPRPPKSHEQSGNHLKKPRLPSFDRFLNRFFVNFGSEKHLSGFVFPRLLSFLQRPRPPQHSAKKNKTEWHNQAQHNTTTHTTAPTKTQHTPQVSKYKSSRAEHSSQRDI